MANTDFKVTESPEVLTRRETAVLTLIARGKSNKELADDLGITEKTVKTHVSNLLSKLKLPSRTQAALYAVRVGLVTVSGDDRNPLLPNQVAQAS